MPESLERRRPRYLGQMVGNKAELGRIRAQMLTGEILRRALIYGPSGAGKTTLAHILARYAMCRDRKVGRGDVCGTCASCRLDLASQESSEFQEWTGAELEENWNWFERHGEFILRQPWFVFFLDESQDLGTLHQKALLRKIEKATAVVLFATTHRGIIVDALENRFGANVYELQYPHRDEVADHLFHLCGERKIQATRTHLLRVADHYASDLRKCVDFVYAAETQCLGRVLTDDFLDAVFGTAEGRRGNDSFGGDPPDKL